jgi:Lon-like protease
MTWWRRRTMRARTLIIGSAVTVVLVALGFAVPIPYVALGPGPTFNTLGSADDTKVISFSGSDIPASVDEKTGDGHLNMTTISTYRVESLFTALGMWAQGNYSLVPYDEVYPPNKTLEQIGAENAQQFSDSQSAAEIAALRYLKYPNILFAGTIPDDSPSAKVLQSQDQIVGIDDRTVTDQASLLSVMSTTKPGQTVTVHVLRDGKPLAVQVTLGASSDSTQKQGLLGIEPQERPKAPFTIDISLEGIGGPSAGLMFTLGIIDKLSPGDLTSGHFIAGTGTMEITDTKGTVGAIGGILLKMIAARDAGATVFLVPQDNCLEAKTQVPQGLQLVKVGTLDDAVNALHTIASGGTPAGC